MRRRSKLLPILPLAVLVLVLVAVWPDSLPSGAGERMDAPPAAAVVADRGAEAAPPAAVPRRASERTPGAVPSPAAPALTDRPKIRFGVRLVLDARPLLLGQVTIEGAKFVDRDGDPIRWFEANAVGTFPAAVTDLPDGVLPPRHWKHDPLMVTVSRAEEVVTFQAVRAAVVHGRVTCPAGPVGPFHVRVSASSDRTDVRWVDPIELQCDENGWYVGEVYPGNSVLAVIPGLPSAASTEFRRPADTNPAYLREFTGPRNQLRTLPPGPPTEVNFAFVKGPRTLRLRLVDRDGTPRPDLHAVLFALHVEADWSEGRVKNSMGNGDAGATSDAKGRILIRHLLPDEYGLVIEPRGYASFTTPGATSLAHRPEIHTIDLRDGDIDRTITVPSPDLRKLEVSFVDRASGLPLRRAGVDVILEPRFGREGEVSRRTSLDAEGVLRVWIEDSEEQVLLLVTDRDRAETYEVRWVAQPGPSLPVTAIHQF